jgi:hypothetical protein
VNHLVARTHALAIHLAHTCKLPDANKEKARRNAFFSALCAKHNNLSLLLVKIAAVTNTKRLFFANSETILKKCHLSALLFMKLYLKYFCKAAQ